VHYEKVESIHHDIHEKIFIVLILKQIIGIIKRALYDDSLIFDMQYMIQVLKCFMLLVLDEEIFDNIIRKMIHG
jgi:hypothetical protein